MQRYLSLIVLLALVSLEGCGTRGALYLPPPQTKPPAAPASVPGPASPAAADLNTAQEPAR
ncbi:lipoprotein [Propionivibrio sp.]|uniref:LptM family lipoprotein n=1 Tax=Propionivibrio sp. TaxID=2212460 RepID=UPI0034414156